MLCHSIMLQVRSVIMCKTYSSLQLVKPRVNFLSEGVEVLQYLGAKLCIILPDVRKLLFCPGKMFTQ